MLKHLRFFSIAIILALVAAACGDENSAKETGQKSSQKPAESSGTKRALLTLRDLPDGFIHKTIDTKELEPELTYEDKTCNQESLDKVFDELPNGQEIYFLNSSTGAVVGNSIGSTPNADNAAELVRKAEDMVKRCGKGTGTGEDGSYQVTMTLQNAPKYGEQSLVVTTNHVYLDQQVELVGVTVLLREGKYLSVVTSIALDDSGTSLGHELAAKAQQKLAQL